MESRADKRKKEMLEMFFNRFGSVSTPKCYLCGEKVTGMSMEVDPHLNTISAKATCHGDAMYFTGYFNEVMAHNHLNIPTAFHPDQAVRVNGKLETDMMPTTTRKYGRHEQEPVTEEEKRDILEVPKNKSLGGYA